MLSAEEQQQLQIRLCTKEAELEIPHNVFSISSTSTTAELQELVTNLITGCFSLVFVCGALSCQFFDILEIIN